MMNPEIIARTQRGLAFVKEHMPGTVAAVRYCESPKDFASCYWLLSGDHLTLGVDDYFLGGDIKAFKQHLYIASRLSLAALALDDYQRFTTGSELFYALLSDSPTVIDAMARLEPPYFCGGRHNPSLIEFKVHMWQLAIQGDYEALQEKVERLAKNGRKKDRVLPAQGKDFFSLLMRGDKQGLEALITANTAIKNFDVLTEHFMCFEGTLEAKICWLKGIQVQIDSPLLPMNLMPIAPLEHYDDVYDFLQPGYVPPKVGFFERLRYKRQQRAKFNASTKEVAGASRKP